MRAPPVSALTLEMIQPGRLVVVLGGQHARVEEHQDDDEPVERLRLDRPSAAPLHASVTPATDGGHHRSTRGQMVALWKGGFTWDRDRQW